MKKLSVMVAVMLITSLASAGVVVYENGFDGANPLAGWSTVGNVGVVDGAVETDLDGSAITDGAAHGSILRFRDIDTVSPDKDTAELLNIDTMYDNSIKQITISFELYYANEDGYSNTVAQAGEFKPRTASGSTTGGFKWYTSGNSRIEYDGATDYVGLYLDEWMTYEFAIDFDTDTFGYVVKRSNGEIIGQNTDLALMTTLNWDAARYLVFNTYANSAMSGSMYLDNLQIATVPEPATMAMFGLGSLLCAYRRRK